MLFPFSFLSTPCKNTKAHGLFLVPVLFYLHLFVSFLILFRFCFSFFFSLLWSDLFFFIPCCFWYCPFSLVRGIKVNLEAHYWKSSLQIDLVGTMGRQNVNKNLHFFSCYKPPSLGFGISLEWVSCKFSIQTSFMHGPIYRRDWRN